MLYGASTHLSLTTGLFFFIEKAKRRYQLLTQPLAVPPLTRPMFANIFNSIHERMLKAWDACSYSATTSQAVFRQLTPDEAQLITDKPNYATATLVTYYKYYCTLPMSIKCKVMKAYKAAK